MIKTTKNRISGNVRNRGGTLSDAVFHPDPICCIILNSKLNSSHASTYPMFTRITTNRPTSEKLLVRTFCQPSGFKPHCSPSCNLALPQNSTKPHTLKRVHVTTPLSLSLISTAPPSTLSPNGSAKPPPLLFRRPRLLFYPQCGCCGSPDGRH